MLASNTERRADEQSDYNWFALHTRTNFEKKVVCQLGEKRIQNFLPLLSARHTWSDRQRLVYQPLFPGYVFVRIAPIQETRIVVLRTVGVIGFVGIRGIGTPIPDGEVQAIQTALEQRVPFQLYPFLSIGQRVRIRGGCLNGMEGFLIAINAHKSLVISVQLIQKSVAIEINGYDVEPIRSEGPLWHPPRISPRIDRLVGLKDKGIQRSGQPNRNGQSVL